MGESPLDGEWGLRWEVKRILCTVIPAQGVGYLQCRPESGLNSEELRGSGFTGGGATPESTVYVPLRSVTHWPDDGSVLSRYQVL